jgi:hypothetical protein
MRSVKTPVIIMSLVVLNRVLLLDESNFPYHCHGANPFVLMCKAPKLIKPEMIWAKRMGEKIAT